MAAAIYPYRPELVILASQPKVIHRRAFVAGLGNQPACTSVPIGELLGVTRHDTTAVVTCLECTAIYAHSLRAALGNDSGATLALLNTLDATPAKYLVAS